LQASFDIINFEADYVRRAIDDHLSARFRDYRYRIHRHWKAIVDAHGVEAARQQPYDSISMEDWAVICTRYQDPAYQV
jgi:hypothetical protein